MRVLSYLDHFLLWAKCVALVVSLWLLRSLYRGITVRLKFRAMQKQGMVSLPTRFHFLLLRLFRLVHAHE